MPCIIAVIVAISIFVILYSLIHGWWFPIMMWFGLWIDFVIILFTNSVIEACNEYPGYGFIEETWVLIKKLMAWIVGIVSWILYLYLVTYLYLSEVSIVCKNSTVWRKFKNSKK